MRKSKQEQLLFALLLICDRCEAEGLANHVSRSLVSTSVFPV